MYYTVAGIISLLYVHVCMEPEVHILRVFLSSFPPCCLRQSFSLNLCCQPAWLASTAPGILCLNFFSAVNYRREPLF